MSLAASGGRGPGAVWSPTHVQVTVLQARGLRAKGPGGTSDAYAVIQVGKEKYATSVSERSLGAPVWREEATFELPPLLSAGAAPAAAATLQLTVLHRALLGLDKFLGRAEVDLRELHQDRGRRKTQWYTLKSKPGKKEKERGEIEVDIQFMRNNMTASMFDLSVKDKSRTPFGKLKDKIRGKNKDSASDTASAIVPSMSPSADSDDDSPSKDKKKKSKIKTLFSKSNLQKTPLSQSMSVLPTSKSDKVLLRPGDFESRWGDDDNEDESSSASDITSPKRGGSADPKQQTHINFSLPKKEGFSFLGLRSKNDSLARSNVCINGNHVYVEQPEGKSETKDSTPSSSPSPQGFRRKHLFSSTENLTPRAFKEPGEAVSSDTRLSESSTKSSSKAMTLPTSWPAVSGDTRENTASAKLEAVRETKESRKHENMKSSLLSLVTGKKDTAKGSEGESPAPVPVPGRREDMPREDGPGPAEDLVKRPEKDPAAAVSGRGKSLNPFEEVQFAELEADPEPKSEPTPPVSSARAPQTKAVKPRLEVSPEVQPTARLPSSPDSPLFFTALPSSPGQTPVPSHLGPESETQPSESPSVLSAFSSPTVAPVSTSTPIKSWPSVDQGQAGSEEPSLLLRAELQKESLTQVPNAVSCALGSLSKETPTPVCKGMEDSTVGESGEIGTEGNTRADGPESSLLEPPEAGQQEGPLRSPPAKQQDSVPSSEGAQGVPGALPGRRGQPESPAGQPPMRVRAAVEGQPGFLEEDPAGVGGMTFAVKPTVPPLHVGEAAPPLGSVMRGHEEVVVNVTEGRKEIRKHVSFSERLAVEEEVETSTGSVEEARSERRERRRACDRASAESAQTEDSEGAAGIAPRPPRSGGPATMEDHLPLPACEENVSEGPGTEASSGTDIPLLGMEGDDTLMTPSQSKASDHEGLLSDPLSGLQSASDGQSPVTADLDLTLPSIPEVASDDERVDEVEDDRETVKGIILEVGALSLNTLPAQPEEAKAPSGEAGGSAAPAESPRDPRSKAAEAALGASAERTPALGRHKPRLGTSSRSDQQRPGPGDGEEAEVLGGGRPGQPPSAAPGPPVASPSFPEPFPATHSSPSSPHTDTHHTTTAEPHKQAAAGGLPGQVENSGKRKPLLQAWVSPSETHPVSAGTGSAKHRLHPVKPMNTTATKIANSNLGTATVISENLINEAMMKKYSPSDPAFAYAQLTHDELIQLVLKQKETISKKEFQVRALEDYIDNLLVRVMEETPSILRIPAQVGRKAGKM